MQQILIIEDETGLRDIIRFLLTDRGFTVLEADNGKQGVEMALAHVPDLIICDIRMPIMDGFETLSAIRSHAVTATVPFLFLTGEDPRSNLRRAMNLGANDFLTKPFDEKELMDVVHLRLSQSEEVRKKFQQEIEDLRKNITLAMPHELRTPLTGLLGIADILRTDAESMSAGEIRDMANMLYASAHRLHHTLDKFWIYTQVEILASDPGAIATARTQSTSDGEEAVRRAAERTAFSFRRAEDLRMNVSPLAPMISTVFLERLLTELLENALKFSDPGKPVEVYAATEGDRIRCTVTDHGRGMNPDQIQSIRAFGQFDRKKYEQQGIGLGLVTVQRLIQIHDGTISIESTPGNGTTVTFTLPAVQPS